MKETVFKEPILLASSSPRRIEMLENLGFSMIVSPRDCDESHFDHLPIKERVMALAELKVMESAKTNISNVRYALGADTLVSIDGKAYGKAADRRQAEEMIKLLSGKAHTVSTGVAVLDMHKGKLIKSVNETTVWFKSMSKQEIDFYLSKNEWFGAAGAYKIQELASFFVEKIEGSFSCIVGLPIHTFYDILLQIGYPFPY